MVVQVAVSKMVVAVVSTVAVATVVVDHNTIITVVVAALLRQLMPNCHPSTGNLHTTANLIRQVSCMPSYPVHG
jgi:hypothetical protein